MKPEPKFTTDRPYKYDRAMLEAIARIGKNYPVPISMVSNVKDFQTKDAKWQPYTNKIGRIAIGQVVCQDNHASLVSGLQAFTNSAVFPKKPTQWEY